MRVPPSTVIKLFANLVNKNVGLVCISDSMNEVDHLWIYLKNTHIPISLNCLLMSSSYFSVGLLLFLLYISTLETEESSSL